MGNENSAPSGSDSSTSLSEFNSVYSLGSRVRASVESTRASSPAEYPDPDLSHLTEEEVAKIKQVMDRALAMQQEHHYGNRHVMDKGSHVLATESENINNPEQEEEEDIKVPKEKTWESDYFLCAVCKRNLLSHSAEDQNKDTQTILQECLHCRNHTCGQCGHIYVTPVTALHNWICVDCDENYHSIPNGVLQHFEVSRICGEPASVDPAKLRMNDLVAESDVTQCKAKISSVTTCSDSNYRKLSEDGLVQHKSRLSTLIDDVREVATSTGQNTNVARHVYEQSKLKGPGATLPKNELIELLDYVSDYSMENPSPVQSPTSVHKTKNISNKIIPRPKNGLQNSSDDSNSYHCFKDRPDRLKLPQSGACSSNKYGNMNIKEAEFITKWNAQSMPLKHNEMLNDCVKASCSQLSSLSELPCSISKKSLTLCLKNLNTYLMSSYQSWTEDRVTYLSPPPSEIRSLSPFLKKRRHSYPRLTKRFTMSHSLKRQCSQDNTLCPQSHFRDDMFYVSFLPTEVFFKYTHRNRHNDLAIRHSLNTRLPDDFNGRSSSSSQSSDPEIAVSMKNKDAIYPLGLISRNEPKVMSPSTTSGQHPTSDPMDLMPVCGQRRQCEQSRFPHSPPFLDLAAYANSIADSTASLTSLTAFPTNVLPPNEQSASTVIVDLPNYAEQYYNDQFQYGELVSPDSTDSSSSVSPVSYNGDIENIEVSKFDTISDNGDSGARQKVRPQSTDRSSVIDLSPILDVSPSVEEAEQKEMLAQQNEDSENTALFLKNQNTTSDNENEEVNKSDVTMSPVYNSLSYSKTPSATTTAIYASDRNLHHNKKSTNNNELTTILSSRLYSQSSNWLKKISESNNDANGTRLPDFCKISNDKDEHIFHLATDTAHAAILAGLMAYQQLIQISDKKHSRLIPTSTSVCQPSSDSSHTSLCSESIVTSIALSHFTGTDQFSSSLEKSSVIRSLTENAGDKTSLTEKYISEKNTKITHNIQDVVCIGGANKKPIPLVKPRKHLPDLVGESESVHCDLSCHDERCPDIEMCTPNFVRHSQAIKFKPGNASNDFGRNSILIEEVLLEKGTTHEKENISHFHHECTANGQKKPKDKYSKAESNLFQEQDVEELSIYTHLNTMDLFLTPDRDAFAHEVCQVIEDSSTHYPDKHNNIPPSPMTCITLNRPPPIPLSLTTATTNDLSKMTNEHFLLPSNQNSLLNDFENNNVAKSNIERATCIDDAKVVDHVITPIQYVTDVNSTDEWNNYRLIMSKRTSQATNPIELTTFTTTAAATASLSTLENTQQTIMKKSNCPPKRSFSAGGIIEKSRIFVSLPERSHSVELSEKTDSFNDHNPLDNTSGLLDKIYMLDHHNSHHGGKHAPKENAKLDSVRFAPLNDKSTNSSKTPDSKKGDNGNICTYSKLESTTKCSNIKACNKDKKGRRKLPPTPVVETYKPSQDNISECALLKKIDLDTTKQFASNQPTRLFPENNVTDTSVLGNPKGLQRKVIEHRNITPGHDDDLLPCQKQSRLLQEMYKSSPKNQHILDQKVDLHGTSRQHITEDEAHSSASPLMANNAQRESCVEKEIDIPRNNIESRDVKQSSNVRACEQAVDERLRLQNESLKERQYRLELQEQEQQITFQQQYFLLQQRLLQHEMRKKMSENFHTQSADELQPASMCYEKNINKKLNEMPMMSPKSLHLTTCTRGYPCETQSHINQAEADDIIETLKNIYGMPISEAMKTVKKRLQEELRKVTLDRKKKLEELEEVRHLQMQIGKLKSESDAHRLKKQALIAYNGNIDRNVHRGPCYANFATSPKKYFQVWSSPQAAPRRMHHKRQISDPMLSVFSPTDEEKYNQKDIKANVDQMQLSVDSLPSSSSHEKMNQSNLWPINSESMAKFKQTEIRMAGFDSISGYKKQRNMPKPKTRYTALHYSNHSKRNDQICLDENLRHPINQSAALSASLSEQQLSIRPKLCCDSDSNNHMYSSDEEKQCREKKKTQLQYEIEKRKKQLDESSQLKKKPPFAIFDDNLHKHTVSPVRMPGRALSPTGARRKNSASRDVSLPPTFDCKEINRTELHHLDDATLQRMSDLDFIYGVHPSRVRKGCDLCNVNVSREDTTEIHHNRILAANHRSRRYLSHNDNNTRDYANVDRTRPHVGELDNANHRTIDNVAHRQKTLNRCCVEEPVYINTTLAMSGYSQSNQSDTVWCSCSKCSCLSTTKSYRDLDHLCHLRHLSEVNKSFTEDYRNQKELPTYSSGRDQRKQDVRHQSIMRISLPESHTPRCDTEYRHIQPITLTDFESPTRFTDVTPAMPLLDDVKNRSRKIIHSISIGSRPVSAELNVGDIEALMNEMSCVESDNSVDADEPIMKHMTEGGVTILKESSRKSRLPPPEPARYNFPVKRILVTRDQKDHSGNGLGLEIVGGKTVPGRSETGAYVTAINYALIAHQLHGELQVGDRILEWNGATLTGKSFEEVEHITAQTNGELELLVKAEYSRVIDRALDIAPQTRISACDSNTIETDFTHGAHSGLDTNRLATYIEKVQKNQPTESVAESPTCFLGGQPISSPCSSPRFDQSSTSSERQKECMNKMGDNTTGDENEKDSSFNEISSNCQVNVHNSFELTEEKDVCKKCGCLRYSSSEKHRCNINQINKLTEIHEKQSNDFQVSKLDDGRRYDDDIRSQKHGANTKLERSRPKTLLTTDIDYDQGKLSHDGRQIKKIEDQERYWDTPESPPSGNRDRRSRQSQKDTDTGPNATPNDRIHETEPYIDSHTKTKTTTRHSQRQQHCQTPHNDRSEELQLLQSDKGSRSVSAGAHKSTNSCLPSTCHSTTPSRLGDDILSNERRSKNMAPASPELTPKVRQLSRKVKASSKESAVKTTGSARSEDHGFGVIQLQLSHDDYDSTLNVHVIQAGNLRPRDINGLSDPFVKLYLLPGRCPENKRRTKHIARTLNPEWHQTLVFPNVAHGELLNKVLELSVWDYDRFKANDFLGELVLELSEIGFLDNKPHWYPLRAHVMIQTFELPKSSVQPPKPSVNTENDRTTEKSPYPEEYCNDVICGVEKKTNPEKRSMEILKETESTSNSSSPTERDRVSRRQSSAATKSPATRRAL